MVKPSEEVLSFLGSGCNRIISEKIHYVGYHEFASAELVEPPEGRVRLEHALFSKHLSDHLGALLGLGDGDDEVAKSSLGG